MKWTPARRVLAAAIILGGLAAFAGSPYLRPKEVSAVQLAQWIKDRKPGLRVVDLRPKAEFDTYHVPTSLWMPASVWLRASARSVPAEAGTYTETVVIVADDPVAIPSRAYVLRGGIEEWRKTSAVSRYFGGVRRGGC